MRAPGSCYFAAVAVLLAASAEASPPVHNWSKSFAFHSSAHAAAVATDGTGNVLVTGDFEGTVNLGGGPLRSAGSPDIFLAKFDADGNHLWSKSFGNFGYDIGSAVATDAAENVYFTGRFHYDVDFGGGLLTSAGNEDIVVAKYDSDGNHLWSRRFGENAEQRSEAIAVDGAGNVAIVGSFYGTVDFGGGPLMSVQFNDMFVVKLDSNGDHIFSHDFGDEGFERSTAVSFDTAGNVVMAGEFAGTLDCGGGPLTSAGGFDILLAKFDEDGDHLWSQSFGDATAQRVNSLAVDKLGNVLIAGYFYGSVDFGGDEFTSVAFVDAYLASFDADGNHNWSRAFGGGNDQVPTAIAVDAANNIAMTGFFEETVDFGGGVLTSEGTGSHELFVVSFEGNGDHLWSRCYANVEYSADSAVALDDAGNVLFTGGFAYNSSVDLGGGPLVAGLADDSFVAKFDGSGQHLWSQDLGQLSGWGYGQSTAVDGAGNVIMSGSFNGTVNFGSGEISTLGQDEDIFLASFDSHGDPRWSQRFGGASNQSGRGVAIDGADNVYLTGDLQGEVNFGGGLLQSAGGEDIFVASFDADGNHRWSQRFGNESGQVARAIAVTNSGNFVIAGDMYGEVDFGGSPLVATGTSADIFVASFDSNGQHLWSKVFVGASDQWAFSVDVDGAGNAFVTGHMSGSVDFGGGLLTTGPSDRDIFLASFDADGNHRWSRRFGDASDQYATFVDTDSAGRVVIAGGFEGSIDFGGGSLASASGKDMFLASFENDGDPRWSRRFGGIGWDEATAIDVDDEGKIFATGIIFGNVDFGGGPVQGALETGMFLASFDAEGTHRFSQRVTSDYYHYPTSVATDGSGSIVLTGYNENGFVDFGGGPLAGSIFLAKFRDDQVPVRFANFAATLRQRAVELRWDVRSDDAQERFTLYRREGTRSQALAIASGLLAEAQPFHVDASVESGQTYDYELVVHTRDGADLRSSTITVTIPALPAALSQNVPNPFNPKTTIEYSLGERSVVALHIYDTAGKLVARLDQGLREAGTHRIEWDGRDQDGHELASGMYLYRLEGTRGVGARKMLLLR